MRLTDVVKNLIIINVIIFAVTMIFAPHFRSILAFHYPSGDGLFQPFQVVTHMFMHGHERVGSLLSMHLIFNMVALAFLGPQLEILWGPKRFLFYYLFTGLGALLFNVIISYFLVNYYGESGGAIWGASGAIFGLMFAFAANFPNQELHLIFPPIRIKALYAILFLAFLELSLGKAPFQTGVAHYAHLSGALSGFLLIAYWDKFGSRL